MLFFLYFEVKGGVSNLESIKYVISNACILCEKCKKRCPKNAIYFNKDMFKYEINEEVCVKCAVCYKNCVYRAINKNNI